MGNLKSKLKLKGIGLSWSEFRVWGKKELRIPPPRRIFFSCDPPEYFRTSVFQSFNADIICNYFCSGPILTSRDKNSGRLSQTDYTMSSILNTERHVKYYLRCLKTFLPSAYLSNDSNRMLLAFLALTGLDVLSALQNKTTPEERQSYINWIYHCQVPTGGFRGFSGTDFGDEQRTSENEAWDPANVPATFFALVNLLILGDDLSRVRRVECLEWLPRMQRENGGFGEVLGPGGKVEGNSDLRYCCCAAGIRYILRGSRGKGLEGVEDIDVSRLMSFIQACQVSAIVPLV